MVSFILYSLPGEKISSFQESHTTVNLVSDFSSFFLQIQAMFFLFMFHKPSLSTPLNMDRQILRQLFCQLFCQIICFILWASKYFLNNLQYWHFLYCFGFNLKKIFCRIVNIYNQQLNIWRNIWRFIFDRRLSYRASQALKVGRIYKLIENTYSSFTMR